PRPRIIGADGEYQAATRLAQAAQVMAADPAALQLRLLQTVVEVAAEKNSRVITVPVPVELLRFLDRAASAAGRAHRPARETRPLGGLAAEGLIGIRLRPPPRGPEGLVSAARPRGPSPTL